MQLKRIFRSWNQTGYMGSSHISNSGNNKLITTSSQIEKKKKKNCFMELTFGINNYGTMIKWRVGEFVCVP
jgi:hypothetical protein